MVANRKYVLVFSKQQVPILILKEGVKNEK